MSWRMSTMTMMLPTDGVDGSDDGGDACDEECWGTLDTASNRCCGLEKKIFRGLGFSIWG